ncbi:MAG: ribosome biogenesis GTPase Der [Puniceicoccales bacterium]|jgi:GTP-binding protein|nr:ribosome biogenesis GTPase Der [Puniceicoccales bacterium]
MKFCYNIAIVGRPNVGKSRLFNRLIGQRLSIVHDQAGVTRDIIAHEIYPNVILMDTGGLGLVDKSEFSSLVSAVEEQVSFAVAAADLIFFVVDASTRIVPLDYDIAELMRKSKKKVILLANKIDCLRSSTDEFAQLGFGEAIALSAEHGIGEDEVRRIITREAAEFLKGEELEEKKAIKISFVGRPNVGKSSTINALLNQNRLIVSDIPGTTRESVKVTLKKGNALFELIDTAGFRASNRVNTSLDYFSSLRTKVSIEKSDVVFLVLDAVEGITKLDKKIANTVVEAGKGLIVIVNKWDIARERFKSGSLPQCDSLQNFQKQFELAIGKELLAVPNVHILFLSAGKRFNINAILPEAILLHGKMLRKIRTGELNRVVGQAFDSHPPSISSGKQFKAYYAVQTGNFPFTFKIFCNRTALLSQSYKKYLLNCLRKSFDFSGCALRVQWSEKEKRFSEEKIN